MTSCLVEAYVSDTARPGNAVSSPKGPTLYANLNISGRQFRLLTILSTKPEISCRLEVAEFGDELSFNALSYVWGDPTLTETILVNEHRIQVTKNLISALRYAPYHLSRSKNATSLKLWVDAICINQMDRTEKGHQVSMMKDIYSQSSIVLCWLGSPTDRIHTAMDAVQAVAHQRHIRCADVMYHENQHELLDSFEQLQSHLKSLHVIDAKMHLPFVEETSMISGIVGDVEIHAVANALQHTTKVIFVILQKPHGLELELCRPALLRAFHELTNWHNQFHERASKLDDTLREHSHLIGFLLALLSYRVRKFSQMCQEYLYQKTFDEAYTNLLWLEQFPWLLEVKEVVGESPTGPAQPLFDVAYWSRIWIRQEIILAHHPVFVCGFRSFFTGDHRIFRSLGEMDGGSIEFCIVEESGSLQAGKGISAYLATTSSYIREPPHHGPSNEFPFFAQRTLKLTSGGLRQAPGRQIRRMIITASSASQISNLFLIMLRIYLLDLFARNS